MRIVVLGLVFALSRSAVADEPKRLALTPAELQAAAEATKLNRDGVRLYEEGQAAEAVAHLRRALAIRRRIYPPGTNRFGHHDLAASLNNLGIVLAATGQVAQALPYYEQAVAVYRRLYPPETFPAGHPYLVVSLNNLGFVLVAMGQPERALPYHEQAVAMCRRLYPPEKYPAGHPYLAASLNNLATTLQGMGQFDKALAHFEQALAIHRQCFPPARFPAGHPELAQGLNNLAGVLWAMGRPEQALPHYEQAVAMHRRLYPPEKYPTGHPDLAASLNNTGTVLQAMGRAEQARPHFEQALAMNRRLYPQAQYPDGHPAVATSLSNLAFVLLAAGRLDQARPHFEQALAMAGAVGRRLMQTAAEAEALAYAQAQPRTRDGYLSATRGVPATDAAAYRAVWDGKAVVARVLEQRQAARRAAAAGHAARTDALTGKRRRIDQLLRDPGRPSADRDRELARLADERDALERELAAAVPRLRRAAELDQLGPDDLIAALPAGAAFIDLVLYSRFDDPGGQERRTPSYAAFVLAKGGPVRRVELGAAKPIDDAVAAWRGTIDGGRGGRAAPMAEAPLPPTAQARGADRELAQLVWAPLARALPPGTTTLYLAPDGDLARVPWAALPLAPSPGSAGAGPGVRAGRVLLEDYALAQVPHGTFLLDHLKFPRAPAGPESLLTLGGVDYGPSTWPALRGTAVEVGAIAALAPGERRAASGGAATAAQLTALLPQARYAHLATHGQFQADALAAERRRAAAAMAARPFGDDSRRVAGKNPLGYVGLVLANGEVMSGLSIVDLPLENLKLVTLSACETGLGDFTGDEGVQGLQRAFHLAGCPNVVASLWQVNDAATAALMAKFYHELWVNKKPPIEALREAQLTIYRHPELIPDLAGERGAPRLKQAAAAKADEPPASATGEPPALAGGGARAATRLWAAFVLSGPGR